MRDRYTGRHGDASKLHDVDQGGDWFKVRGPLNVPCPPRGHPVQVLSGIVPVIGQTRHEALDLERELKALVLPQAALSFMSASMNHDLAQYPLHQRVPDIPSQLSGSRGRFQAVLQKARDEDDGDGFVVLPAVMPLGADDFLDQVVPRPQERGAFRSTYPGQPLRDTLGLAVPPHQFSSARVRCSFNPASAGGRHCHAAPDPAPKA